MKLFWFVQAVYFITILFEYYSVASAYRANQREASKQDKVMLSGQVLNQQRVTYSLEWLVGALLMTPVLFLVNRLNLGALAFTAVLIPLFLARNVIYSFMSHIYLSYQLKALKRRLESSHDYQPYHQAPTPKNAVKRG